MELASEDAVVVAGSSVVVLRLVRLMRMLKLVSKIRMSHQHQHHHQQQAAALFLASLATLPLISFVPHLLLPICLQQYC